MGVFQSRLTTNTAGYAKNHAEQLVLIDKMRQLQARAQNLSERRRPRFEERGQLTPRERLACLLDAGMPFLELYNMTGYCVDDPNPDTSVPGASSLAGIGYVSGVRVMVQVDDSGIAAGAATKFSFVKMLHCMRLAREKKLPYIHLVESAGANLLTYEVEGWAHGGEVFYSLARLSAAGIPTIAVLHGPSTAGGAYMPGLSDYVIGVKRNGMAALAGAALTRAATGEITDDCDLGGAEMHARVSGLVEYLANDDADGIAQCRALVAKLDWNRHCQLPLRADFAAPIYAADDLLGLVPLDYKKAYDCRELVARIVDGSDFLEFKPDYGVSTVCMQAHVHGHAIGLIGNNGPIDPAGATKAAQFFQLCDTAGLPLVFFNNITGYMVGKTYEQAGMIKHGSKMIQAVSNVRVPKITFYVGASFGAGNYGMAGLGYHPDFLFTWPGAITGVMGGEQAATTMEQVAIAGAKRRGIKPDKHQLAQQRARIEAHFNKQCDAFYTSGRMLDQGMIDPRDTRNVLALALQICWEAQHRTVRPNSFGVARM